MVPCAWVHSRLIKLAFPVCCAMPSFCTLHRCCRRFHSHRLGSRHRRSSVKAGRSSAIRNCTRGGTYVGSEHDKRVAELAVRTACEALKIFLCHFGYSSAPNSHIWGMLGSYAFLLWLLSSSFPSRAFGVFFTLLYSHSLLVFVIQAARSTRVGAMIAADLRTHCMGALHCSCI